ncbi:hypothetical protein F5J12DRAFT_717148, partial [Pisolithus orientalis]|uniref:uncharacterized protein n=1 Tax=Pisolithus orientalis TaxID=936130 RepID=UPI0022241B01
KVPEESQLVFRGGGNNTIRELLEGGQRFVEGSIECAALMDETNFINGGDTGTGKKKPIFTRAICHGFHEVESTTEGIVRTSHRMISIACLRYPNIFVSGRRASLLKLHPPADPDFKLRSFSFAGAVEVPGVVNFLQLLSVPKDGLGGAIWANT